ncbi:MAG: bifunctional nuclease family protein [Nitrospirales bacterium]|nr:bifunctional nuclease family protein [Nitrospirales bacterium]
MKASGTRAILCLLSVGFVVTGSFVQGESERANAQVEIKQVEVRLSDHGPIVLLKAEDRVIPIFVDATVAGSIQAALTGQKLSRPLSHDLMRTILDSFGGKVTQTVITLKDGVFRGALTIVLNDTTKVFDGRSSDAIALAVHFKAPIVVGRDLLDSTGKTMPDSKTMTL